MDQETAMNKHQIKGRIKEIGDRLKEVIGDRSLQGRGMTEKKIKKIQGDYRDTTHALKRRH
jgi:uncharacterized protein YjbJ (UPF0337 family)